MRQALKLSDIAVKLEARAHRWRLGGRTGFGGMKRKLGFDIWRRISKSQASWPHLLAVVFGALTQLS